MVRPLSHCGLSLYEQRRGYNDPLYVSRDDGSLDDDLFHEKRKAATLIGVALAVVGVGILSWLDSGEVQTMGIVLELISALCFAFYLIRVNHSRVSAMDGTKLTFYVMTIGAAIFGAAVFYEQADFGGQHSYTLIPDTEGWYYLVVLALLCTVVTNLSLVYSTKFVGPTITSVLGALEPVTAILIGTFFLGEALTLHTLMGIGIILPAVLIIVLSNRQKEKA